MPLMIESTRELDSSFELSRASFERLVLSLLDPVLLLVPVPVELPVEPVRVDGLPAVPLEVVGGLAGAAGLGGGLAGLDGADRAGAFVVAIFLSSTKKGLRLTYVVFFEPNFEKKRNHVEKMLNFLKHFQGARSG
jgi:hypothetical protein